MKVTGFCCFFPLPKQMKFPSNRLQKYQLACFILKCNQIENVKNPFRLRCNRAPNYERHMFPSVFLPSTHVDNCPWWMISSLQKPLWRSAPGLLQATPLSGALALCWWILAGWCAIEWPWLLAVSCVICVLEYLKACQSSAGDYIIWGGLNRSETKAYFSGKICMPGQLAVFPGSELDTELISEKWIFFCS